MTQIAVDTFIISEFPTRYAYQFTYEKMPYSGITQPQDTIEKIFRRRTECEKPLKVEADFAANSKHQRFLITID